MAKKERGVQPGDVTGILKATQRKMLEKSMQKMNLAKRRMWSTLRRRRTWAERIATAAWEKTALFEPFGGSCTVTRIAAEEFGWACTQLMDKGVRRPGRPLEAKKQKDNRTHTSRDCIPC